MTTSASGLTSTMILGCALQLDDARRSGRATSPLRATGALTLDDAYAVQAAGIRLRVARGERVVGVAVFRTDEAASPSDGADGGAGGGADGGAGGGIAGALTDAMQVPDGGVPDLAIGIHPRARPAMAFRLGRGTGTGAGTGARESDPHGAVDAVAPALVIVDSRYGEADLTLEDEVADNAAGSHFAVGPWVESSGEPVRLTDRAVQMRIGGAAAWAGTVAEVTGDPWRTVARALRLAAHHGLALPPDAVLLLGGAPASVSLGSGGTVTVEITGLGAVSLARP